MRKRFSKSVTNMKIRIKSRKALEKLSVTPFTENVAIISITDVGDASVDLKFLPQNLLSISFNDIDNDVMIDELGRTPTDDERIFIENKYHMLTDEQANQIATFYFSVCDKVDCIICQCEHGQSRSAAVAAAILEYRSRKGVSIFADDRYYPNKVVFRKVLASLKAVNKR